MTVPLSRIAHARSGDKGDTANVGVIAYDPKHYPLLVREVTPERVKAHFGELVRRRSWSASNSLILARSTSLCTKPSAEEARSPCASTPKAKRSAPACFSWRSKRAKRNWAGRRPDRFGPTAAESGDRRKFCAPRNRSLRDPGERRKISAFRFT